MGIQPHSGNIAASASNEATCNIAHTSIVGSQNDATAAIVIAGKCETNNTYALSQRWWGVAPMAE